MERVYVEIIGFAAGTCTTLAFLPQIFKIARTGKARDISVAMYLVLGFGIFLWLIYGLNIEELPIIIANSVSLVLCVTVIAMKFIFSMIDRSSPSKEE